MKETIRYFLKPETEEELDTFGEWAFGSSYRELDHSLKFMKAWNDIHGDVLTLSQDSVIADDLPKMIEMWKITLA